MLTPAKFAIAPIAASMILVVTLFPFDMYFGSGPFLARAAFAVSEISATNGNIRDFLANILLFVPFGFGMAAVAKHAFQRFGMALLACAAACVFSTTIELIQTLSPTRDPSFFDILANSLGAVLGTLYFGPIRQAVLTVSATVKCPEALRGPVPAIIATTIYGGLIHSTMIHDAQTVQLRNWDETYHLHVGNESSGDRPWCGRLNRFVLTDTVSRPDETPGQTRGGVSKAHVVSQYDLDGGTSDPGFIRTANDCMDTGGSGKQVAGAGPVWIKSAEPAAEISSGIMSSSAFTLFLDLELPHREQFGPARIFTISNGVYQRNLTVGQDGDSLVLRIRTELSGLNATAPEYVFPHALEGDGQRLLEIAYDGATLSAAILGKEMDRTISWRFSPAAAFLLNRYPKDIDRLQLTRFGDEALQALCSLLIFLPIGMILGRTPSGHLRREVFVGIAIMLVVAWEILLALRLPGVSLSPLAMVFDLAAFQSGIWMADFLRRGAGIAPG